MEMFVLSYVHVLCIYHKLCLQVGSVFKLVLLRTNLRNQYVILIRCSPNVNETIYLYGNLPFFKIHANRFMAQDDSPGAIL